MFQIFEKVVEKFVDFGLAEGLIKQSEGGLNTASLEYIVSLIATSVTELGEANKIFAKWEKEGEKNPVFKWLANAFREWRETCPFVSADRR